MPEEVPDKSAPQIDPAQVSLGLSTRDLMELALWLEKAGMEFYRLLSEEAKDEPLRIFFLKLMGMELGHQRMIQDMFKGEPLAEAKKAGFDETLTQREFFVQLRELLRKKVFPEGLAFLTELDQYKTPRDALAMALAIETQAIKLYKSLAGFKMPYESKAIITRLIAEEEKHIAEVNNIIANMGTA